MIPPWYQTFICILKEVFYLMTSVAAIHVFYGTVITSREQLKRFICQLHYVFHPL